MSNINYLKGITEMKSPILTCNLYRKSSGNLVRTFRGTEDQIGMSLNMFACKEGINDLDKDFIIITRRQTLTQEELQNV